MKFWLALAAANGFLAVAAGAFGAHGLQGRLDAPALQVFETAARYHMYHALAMAVAALAGRAGRDRAAVAACACFLAGIVLFSGSLYLLPLTGQRWLGMITPVGGMAFLAGWGALGATALAMRR